MAMIETFCQLLSGLEVLAGLLQLLGFESFLQLIQHLPKRISQGLLFFRVWLVGFCRAGFSRKAIQSVQQGGAPEIAGPVDGFQYHPGLIGLLAIIGVTAVGGLQRHDLVAVLAEALDCGYITPQRLHQVLVGFLFLFLHLGVPGGFQPAVLLGFLQGIQGGQGGFQVRILMFQFVKGVFQ